MPPKCKDRGRAARLPCKHTQSATSTHDNLQPEQHQSAAESIIYRYFETPPIAVSQLTPLPSEKHALPSLGNNAAMAN